MSLCLCKTDYLEYKGFINGNEYNYEFDEVDNMFKIYSENQEGYWFCNRDMYNWFIKY
jgi:hypothetical protein